MWFSFVTIWNITTLVNCRKSLILTKPLGTLMTSLFTFLTTRENITDPPLPTAEMPTNLPRSACGALRHQAGVPLPPAQVYCGRATGQHPALCWDEGDGEPGRGLHAVLEPLVQVGTVQPAAQHVTAAHRTGVTTHGMCVKRIATHVKEYTLLGGSY